MSNDISPDFSHGNQIRGVNSSTFFMSSRTRVRIRFHRFFCFFSKVSNGTVCKYKCMSLEKRGRLSLYWSFRYGGNDNAEFITPTAITAVTTLLTNFFNTAVFLSECVLVMRCFFHLASSEHHETASAHDGT